MLLCSDIRICLSTVEALAEKGGSTEKNICSIENKGKKPGSEVLFNLICKRIYRLI